MLLVSEITSTIPYDLQPKQQFQIRNVSAIKKVCTILVFTLFTLHFVENIGYIVKYNAILQDSVFAYARNYC